MKRNNIIKAALVIIIIAIIFLVSRYIDFNKFSPEVISKKIREFGHLSSFIYLLLLSILPLFLFPDSVIVIAGGMVFGLFWGTVLTSVGSLIGALLAYYLAKYLGSGFVRKFVKKDLVDITSGKSGFLLILILRLVPLFPFKVVSYSAGLAEVDIKEFILATIIGSMPGILVYVNLGDKVNRIGSGEFYLAIFLLIGLTAVFTFIKYIYEKNLKKMEDKGKI